MVSRTGKHLAFILLLAICVFTANNLLNRHHHYIYKHHFIFHAHPYPKDETGASPVESHHHSELEILILDLISNSPLFMLFIMALGSLFILLQILRKVRQPEPKKTVLILLKDPRAPPF